jgi:hypothetical protein
LGEGLGRESEELEEAKLEQGAVQIAWGWSQRAGGAIGVGHGRVAQAEQ